MVCVWDSAKGGVGICGFPWMSWISMFIGMKAGDYDGVVGEAELEFLRFVCFGWFGVGGWFGGFFGFGCFFFLAMGMEEVRGMWEMMGMGIEEMVLGD